MPKSEELLSDLFFRYAVQYYVAGRSAFFAGSIPVAGNLFHSALEMFLKSALKEKGYSAAKLKNDFAHDVRKLWKEYKNLVKQAALNSYDAVINDINLMERIRYPSKSFTFNLAPKKEARRSGVTGPATKGFTRFYLNLEDTDELVTLFLKTVTPDWLRSLLTHGDAEAQYKRDNLHTII